jgi:hypothetical protein
MIRNQHEADQQQSSLQLPLHLHQRVLRSLLQQVRGLLQPVFLEQQRGEELPQLFA